MFFCPNFTAAKLSLLWRRLRVAIFILAAHRATQTQPQRLLVATGHLELEQPGHVWSPPRARFGIVDLKPLRARKGPRKAQISADLKPSCRCQLRVQSLEAPPII